MPSLADLSLPAAFSLRALDSEQGPLQSGEATGCRSGSPHDCGNLGRPDPAGKEGCSSMHAQDSSRPGMKPLASLAASKSSAGSAEELFGPPTPPSGERETAAAGASSGTLAAAVPAQPAAAGVDYAALYRERFRRELAEEQATAMRRLRRRLWRAWHAFSITWGLFVLEPWEAAVVLVLLLVSPTFLLWRMLWPA
ncbi:hypothetical protein ABPG75_013181 [Micractinium tetrahymenae]